MESRDTIDSFASALDVHLNVEGKGNVDEEEVLKVDFYNEENVDVAKNVDAKEVDKEKLIDEELNATTAPIGGEETSTVADAVTLPKVLIKPKKFPFKLKQVQNGNILTVHHTVQEEEKLIRIRMAVSCFNERSSELIAVDKRGNVFVFDFVSKRYWRLWVKVPKVSTVRQSLRQPNEYLCGTKLGHVLLLDVARSSILRDINVSAQRITQITFPGQPLQPSSLALIHAGHEAILLNLDNYTATHRLDFDELLITLKYACYVPHSEQIFTLFTNDALHIWSGVTLNTLRVAHPLKARDRKVRLDNASIAEVTLATSQRQSSEFRVHCQDKDYADGMIVAYTFSPDGGLLCLSTIDGYLLLLSAYTYELQSCLRLKDFVISACVFLPQPKATLLLGVTTAGQVLLIDAHCAEFKLIVQPAHALQLSISADGKLLAVLADTGELYIWSTCRLYNLLRSQQQCMQLLQAACKQRKPMAVFDDNSKLAQQLKSLLERDRLLAILQEYGCYPAKYRAVIWCSLLQLPSNRSAFQTLTKMPAPDVVKERSAQLQMKTETNKRLLLRTWSCLAHWCRVFAHSEFLPALIFPFVQVFPTNALVAFELCATLLLNQFQLWFEFHPLPPSNYLGMCANLLQCFDRPLFLFYVTQDIKPQHYAWSLLSSAFSEVLDAQEWLCLWDNIISSPPFFPVFCVVAYNMLQREQLMRLPDKQSIEHYFHEQNPLDVCKLVTKAYAIWRKCPEAIHPKRYVPPFVGMPKNAYAPFLNYPKQWLAQHEDEVGALKQQQRDIDERIRALELEEQNMMERLESGLREEEQAKSIKEMETLYQNTLKREEERVACQRKMLLLYQKEIRSRKGEVLATLQESERRKKALQMDQQLSTLMHNIERERVRNDTNLMLAEDELRNQELELLAQNQYAQQRPSLKQTFRKEMNSLEKERQKLNQSLAELNLQAHQKQPESSLRKDNLMEIESKIEEIQLEFLSLTKRK